MNDRHFKCIKFLFQNLEFHNMLVMRNFSLIGSSPNKQLQQVPGLFLTGCSSSGIINKMQFKTKLTQYHIVLKLANF